MAARIQPFRGPHTESILSNSKELAGRSVLIGKCPHGIAIRERARDNSLFLISLANESIGYVCHARAYEEGGYESGSSRFAPGSGVGDRNIVGIGSVVLGRIAADESLVSGFPAAPVRSIAAELAAGRYRFCKGDWVE